MSSSASTISTHFQARGECGPVTRSPQPRSPRGAEGPKRVLRPSATTQVMTQARKVLFDQLLKEAFPHVRFRVIVGVTVFFEECISVRWTNGPTERRVKQLIGAPGRRGTSACTGP